MKNYFEDKFPKLKEFHTTIKAMEEQHNTEITPFLHYDEINNDVTLTVLDGNPLITKEIKETIQNRFTVLLKR